jgi:F0F1-type ATP synthase membrane subunit c/vacuolar-type H+-ATPase subunit K
MTIQAMIVETALAHADNNALPFAVRAALGKVTGAENAPTAAAALGDAIAMAETMATAIEAATKDMRERFAMILQELPAKALPVEGKHHTYTISAARDGVRITDIDAIPAELMRTPPPSPDKAAILKLLSAGVPVAGCTLSNGGMPSLRINARKSAT